MYSLQSISIQRKERRMTTPALMDEVQGAYNHLTEDELVNLGIVLGAYRSFRGDRRSHVAYVSMPITSGRRLYDVFMEEGVRTKEELSAKCGKAALWDRVIQPNITEGIAFADSLGQRENLLFIAPSVFEAKRWRWTEDAYMSLWYRVIAEMSGKLVVMDGWEYSDGGVAEVLFAQYLRWRVVRRSNVEDWVKLRGLKNFFPGMSYKEIIHELEKMWEMRVFDSGGKEIRLDVALQMVTDAVFDLKAKGFQYKKLLDNAYRMMYIPFYVGFHHPDDSDSVLKSDAYNESRVRIKSLL